MVSKEDIDKFLAKTRLNIKKLKAEYKKDQFLRNLDFSIFDKNIHDAAKCEPELVEIINSCLWKFILVFKVLGAKPEFLSQNHFFENARL